MGRLPPLAGTWVPAREAASFAADVPRQLGWSQLLGAVWRVPDRVLLIAGREEMRPEWRQPPGVAFALVRRDTDQPPRVLAKWQVRECELTAFLVLVQLAADPTRRPPADVTPGAPGDAVAATATAHTEGTP